MSINQEFSRAIEQRESQQREYLAPPRMDKRVILGPAHREKFNPDGTLNKQYYVRGAGVYYDSKTGKSIMLFEGSEPYFDRDLTAEERLRVRVDTHERFYLFGAKSSDNWGNTTFFDATYAQVERVDAKPILFSSDTTGMLARHGLEDVRITPFPSNQDNQAFFITVNALNRNAIDASRLRARGDKKKPLYGSNLELFMAYDLADSQTYTKLGFIGPEEYFKNVIVHPAPILVDGVPSIMIIGRKLPSIQGFSIPLIDFPRLIHDPEFRKKYWDEQLQPGNIAKNTILDPLFAWEGKDDPTIPQGQIAGGAPPFTVPYIDKTTGIAKQAWMFIYNGVPGFETTRMPKGRMVGVALLDYDDPRKVIARSPEPIVSATTPEELTQGVFKNITFATSAYVDNEGILRIVYSAGDSFISMASCPLSSMMDYITQFNEQGKQKE